MVNYHFQLRYAVKIQYMFLPEFLKVRGVRNRNLKDMILFTK